MKRKQFLKSLLGIAITPIVVKDVFANQEPIISTPAFDRNLLSDRIEYLKKYPLTEKESLCSMDDMILEDDKIPYISIRMESGDNFTPNPKEAFEFYKETGNIPINSNYIVKFASSVHKTGEIPFYNAYRYLVFFHKNSWALNPMRMVYDRFSIIW